MKVAVFGTQVQEEFLPVLRQFFRHLNDKGVEIDIYRPFDEFLAREMHFTPHVDGFFSSHEDFSPGVSFVFSIGGDGTFLHSFLTIRNSHIPIVGVNSGRLGFLADIGRDQVIDGLTSILEGQFTMVERSLLEVTLHGAPNFEFNYALNEMTVLKTDSSSMINIQTSINGEFMNSIWADGLIIATPTGSTAYSLSVGGPILAPDAANFVINPIAPHNLTVRPVVVPDHYELFLRVEGRGNQFLTSLDSRSVSVPLSTTLSIRKADFRVRTLHLPGQTFFETLRNKLMWGADNRN
ncbi:MAG TPA: NAD kinase [Prolixibacteraceae bacterium]|jgi:NAD+ kinase|nr:NAD kinase [Prolixibacteraceae bacterium]